MKFDEATADELIEARRYFAKHEPQMYVEELLLAYAITKRK